MIALHSLSFTVLLVLSLSVTSCNKSEKQDRPNIIYIMTDDQRWDAFHFAGHIQLITPNLDQMASEGVVFTNVFHATPICEPSRASIMLSQYPTRHMCGFDKPYNYTISGEEFAKSYPAALRNAGYFTGFVGKFGFAVTENKFCNVADYDPRISKSRQATSQLWLKDENMPKEEFDLWYGFAGQGSYDINGRHGTLVRGEQACEFIRQAAPQDKPFCLSISLKAPHGPFTAAPEFLALYDTMDISRYFNDKKEFHNLLPAVVREQYRGRKGHSEERWDSFIKNYFGLITGADYVVGLIREELKKQGLDDNTIIFYTSDNGFFNGSKGLSGKDLLYEESLRAPLIICDPRLPGELRGRTNNALVSTIDFGPTILDMAGISAPGTMDGVSILPALYGHVKEVRTDIFAENNFADFRLNVEEAKDKKENEALLAEGTVRSRCVRTKKFKYIRYHETKPMVEELYAVEIDPNETFNLINNPEYNGVLNELRTACDNYMKYNKQKQLR